jgi:hypothetical protein
MDFSAEANQIFIFIYYTEIDDLNISIQKCSAWTYEKLICIRSKEELIILKMLKKEID